MANYTPLYPLFLEGKLYKIKIPEYEINKMLLCWFRLEA